MSGFAKKFQTYQNALQNAGKLKKFKFVYYEIGNSTANILILVLALILLTALLRSEARYRALLEGKAVQTEPTLLEK